MHVLENVSLSPFTTFKLGGNARYFKPVHNRDELVEAVSWARHGGIPFMVIGGGSNLLVSDDGFQGLIIRNQIPGHEYYKKDGSTFIGVGAGENWDDFVALTVSRGLYGLENLSGIPGSVGATPIQNVGAYGREVSEFISWVEVLDTETMEFELFTNSDCKFAYRDSIFKSHDPEKYIVVEVGFKLADEGVPNISYRDLTNYFNESKARPDLKTVRSAVLSIREGKFPDLNQHGCGGSFFQNPVVSRSQLQSLQKRYKDIPFYSYNDDQYKVPLAWVLEHAVPWKGVRRKNVGVSERQPLILVHYGNGSANEVKRLADDITQSVGAEASILISPEVRLVGNF